MAVVVNRGETIAAEILNVSPCADPASTFDVEHVDLRQFTDRLGEQSPLCSALMAIYRFPILREVHLGGLLSMPKSGKV